MLRLIKHQLNLVLTALMLMVTMDAASADVGPDDLKGEDKVMFDRFRQLFQNGSPETFFDFASGYEAELRGKGYMMLYYKLLNNEGFYALRHNMLFRAMQTAERLDSELRQDGAQKYFYLATGLMADIYYTSHDRKKAGKYFVQAIDEAGDIDPKFTMRCYQSLAEMLCLKDSRQALAWADKAMSMAKATDNTEYYSLSLAMKAYIYFLDGDNVGFYRAFEEYHNLRSMEKPGFSHRYDKILKIAKLSFDGDYRAASSLLADKGTVYVDSSLVAIRIFAMERDVEKGFSAMKRRYLEMDSLNSVIQSANFDEMATERTLLRSKAEVEASKRRARSYANWLMGVVVVFLVIYLMGRRRLVMKIRERNQELKNALARAEESDRMKTAFIRSMSHEIRTPLNAVSGFSQVLCDPEYDLSVEEKLDMQKRISDNVNQVTMIINEVLELSKTESEAFTSEAEKTGVGCNELGRSVLSDVKGKQRAGVELRFSSNVKDDFKLLTNAYRLRKALAHLIDNALKFTEKGHVELRCEKRDGRMLFIVTDTGVGISEEHCASIFDTFSKVDDFKVGIGLGLPLCRRLVHSLGGEVELDTNYREGCRFVISLPLG